MIGSTMKEIQSYGDPQIQAQQPTELAMYTMEEVAVVVVKRDITEVQDIIIVRAVKGFPIQGKKPRRTIRKLLVPLLSILLLRLSMVSLLSSRVISFQRCVSWKFWYHAALYMCLAQPP